MKLVFKVLLVSKVIVVTPDYKVSKETREFRVFKVSKETREFKVSKDQEVETLLLSAVMMMLLLTLFPKVSHLDQILLMQKSVLT